MFKSMPQGQMRHCQERLKAFIQKKDDWKSLRPPDEDLSIDPLLQPQTSGPAEVFCSVLLFIWKTLKVNFSAALFHLVHEENSSSEVETRDRLTLFGLSQLKLWIVHTYVRNFVCNRSFWCIIPSFGAEPLSRTLEIISLGWFIGYISIK